MRCELRRGVPLGFHVMMRPRDGRAILTNRAERLVATRALLGQGEQRGLVMHAAADTHAHAAVLTHRDAAGRFAHDVETSLRMQLPHIPPFEPALIKPIESQGQLTTLFWYLLNQEAHHGTNVDPGYEGTALPDLIGARLVLTSDGPRRVAVVAPGIAARVAAALPRIRGAELAERLGGREMIDFPVALEDLTGAAAAAVGLVSLRHDGGARSAALCAAVHAVAHPSTMLGQPVTPMQTRAIADALGVTARSVQRYRDREPLPGMVRAVAYQWRIRGHLRRRAEEQASRLFLLPDGPSPPHGPPLLEAPQAILVP